MSSEIDLGPEWRAYDEEERRRKSRVGPPLTPLIHDMGLGTIVDPAVDGRGRRLYGAAALQASRLANANAARSARERRLISSLRLLHSICNNMELPRHVCEEAASMIHKLVIRHAYLEPARIVYTALYAASIQHSHPAAIDLRRSGMVDHRLAMRLGVRADTPRLVVVFIEKIGHELGLPDVTRGIAARIAAAWLQRLQGKTPRAIAAACVYVAAKIMDHQLRQADVARAAATTDTSIRTVLKTVKPTITYIYGDTTIWTWRYGQTFTGILRPTEACSLAGVYCRRPDPHNITITANSITVILG